MNSKNNQAKKVIKLFRPVIIILMRSWWFVTRPKTRGTKIVIICEDEILLLKTTYGYNYTLPGGGIDRNETPESAIRRESLEEVGIGLDMVVPLIPFVSNYEYKNDTVYGFYAEVKTKKYFLNNLEIDVAEWHKLDSLPKTGPVTARIIELFKNT
ncbi:MAG: NUDIX domain-containing protein, partial [Candidatus Magasanikbacteria bacterium]|nr:NUDIX domain-containing protein [Candidatus Magasanikbacteria bacterium]